jgi:uncharacterized protein (DUF1697 family)
MPSMTRYALLLRGINLGSRRKVPMARLREVLTGAGFEDVRTLLNSGNAVVSTSASARTVEESACELLEGAFGFPVPVMARTAAQMTAVVERTPFPEALEDPKGFHVLFCTAKPAKAALDDVEPAVLASDRLALVGRELYLHLPNGFSGSAVMPWLSDARLGVKTTARTFQTVTKLAALTSTPQ